MTPRQVEAQVWAPDTLDVEVAALGATQGEIPFWLHANTHGRVDPETAGALTRLRARRTFALTDRASITLGVETVGRASGDETLHLVEGFGRVRYGFLQLRAGRKKDPVGFTAGDLSSGSLATSTNAIPFPEVVLSTTGYTDVPFTRGYVEFDARFGHGWMTGDRYVTDAFLHHKTLYGRLGGALPVNVYGGLVHNAMWGGTSRDPEVGTLPTSLDDYVRTVFARGAGEGAPEPDQVYVQGNHLGIWDFGLSVALERLAVRVYRHMPFEDGDNLEFKSPQDGLLGVELTDRRDDRWLDRIVYEHLYTKWQNGPVAPGRFERGGAGGQDNYYNNFAYKDGWTNFGRTVGSPLLTPGARGIDNNRVVGHHLGLAGHLGPIDYRALASYTRNYGTYAEREGAQDRGVSYRFSPPLEQMSVLVETQMTWPTQPRLDVQAAVAVDVGDLYDDGVGLRLGVVYRPAL